jgi:ribonuclease VapC
MAILFNEPESLEFASKIEQSKRTLMSATSVLEATIALEGRKGSDAGMDLDQLLHRCSVEVVPFDVDQLALARIAFRRYGKGRHKAALNFGDCASYALAQWSGEPLLFKGNEFAATDVDRVR